MSRVFDTTFEMSLRLTLLLSEGGIMAKTTDMLSLIDTIAIYGREFGIANTNLHGGIDYVLDEYDSRRELVKTALKYLVLRGLTNISESSDGFCYAITDGGIAFAGKLTSDYASEYRILARAAIKLTASKSEREIFAMINESCGMALERRRGNG